MESAKNIEELKQIIEKKTFGLEDIYKIIPQRDPFLMIDEVINIDINRKKILCKKTIKEDKDWFLKGHFPNNPIVPGVIMIEMMAQTSCVLCKSVNIDKIGTYLLTGVDKCKFAGISTIGDELNIYAEIIREKKDLFISTCNIAKNDKIIAQCQITAFRKEI